MMIYRIGKEVRAVFSKEEQDAAGYQLGWQLTARRLPDGTLEVPAWYAAALENRR